MSREMDVSVVIVSYNTCDLLRDCLRSIIACTSHIRYEIIVVDNNSTDGTPAMIKKEFPEVILVVSEVNKGFASANNRGIELSAGKTVLLLNPDTIVLNEAIPRLYRFLTENSQAGIVGPKLYLNRDLEYHPSVGRFTHPLHAFYAYLPFYSKWMSLYNNWIFKKDRLQKVDWIWGAAFLIRREVFEAIGMLDEGYFLYSEEEDFCRRASNQGYQVYYYPSAEIIHLGGRSSEQVKLRSFQYYWESRMRYFAKFCTKRQVRLFRIYFPVLIRMKRMFRPNIYYDQIIDIVSRSEHNKNI